VLLYCRFDCKFRHFSVVAIEVVDVVVAIEVVDVVVAIEVVDVVVAFVLS